MTITTNLAHFGQLELKQLELLLKAYREQGLPDNFSPENIYPCLNQNSGFVFLTNDDYQAALLTDDNKLELWHTCFNCGHEGFKDDFDHEPIDDECKEHIKWVLEGE